MFHSVPHQVLPHGQNQCPEGTNFKLLACPYHGIENWLVLQNFYDGLIPMSRSHLDAAAGCTFLSHTIDGATALINKMVSNQS